jgi:hypothetical protein
MISNFLKNYIKSGNNLNYSIQNRELNFLNIDKYQVNNFYNVYNFYKKDSESYNPKNSYIVNLIKNLCKETKQYNIVYSSFKEILNNNKNNIESYKRGILLFVDNTILKISSVTILNFQKTIIIEYINKNNNELVTIISMDLNKESDKDNILDFIYTNSIVSKYSDKLILLDNYNNTEIKHLEVYRDKLINNMDLIIKYYANCNSIDNCSQHSFLYFSKNNINIIHHHFTIEYSNKIEILEYHNLNTDIFYTDNMLLLENKTNMFTIIKIQYKSILLNTMNIGYIISGVFENKNYPINRIFQYLDSYKFLIIFSDILFLNLDLNHYEYKDNIIYFKQIDNFEENDNFLKIIKK